MKARSATVLDSAVSAQRVDGPAFGRAVPALTDWIRSEGTVAYPDAVAAMERRVATIRSGAPELVWLVEHSPLYTAGTSARETDLLWRGRFPVFHSGRGGQHTYHGPGQRVAYVMLDLAARKPDLRRFVSALEEWIIRTLARFAVAARRTPGRIGVWVPRPDKGRGREDKIAAIGVRVRHWVTFHGVALNVDPVLEHFSGIVPCGVRDQGVTSLAELGVEASMAAVDDALRTEFEALFGPTLSVSAGP
jgi:lipoyl(octanoyl) transferase